MFHYKNIGEIQKEAKNEGIYLPFGEDTAPLKTGVRLEGREIPNRIAIQPMEGCDGAADGKPDELTLRRYDKFAKSGAGLIWEEATAVWEEGRANPRQLWIKEENLDAFRAMNDRIREISMKENGFAPLIIMQATHSGRYSKPHGVPEPLIAYNSPIFEKNGPIPEERIVSDDYLKRLIKRMGEAAYLAQKAGFDGWTSNPATGTWAASFCPPTPAPAFSAAALKTAPGSCGKASWRPKPGFPAGSWSLPG